MARYIDTDEVEKGIRELQRSPWAQDEGYCFAPRSQTIKEALGAVLDLCVRDAPTADVEPVKRGRWIKLDDEYDDITWRCSECHAEWTFTGEDETPLDCEMRYFQCCGAKMVLEGKQ